MSASLLQMIPGFGLLLLGGVSLVAGASALARTLGVSQLVIGLTVVGFGTSAPELGVNLVAALNGNTDVSFGNVVGSNLANVGLILGLAALLRPLVVEGVVIRREIPMMLLASGAAWIMASDGLRGEARDVFDRPEGMLLLLLFGVFLYYTIAETFRRRADDPLVAQVLEETIVPGWHSNRYSLIAILGGLALLVVGAALTVNGASGFAAALGVPEAVIAVTIVALGTSLPELTTSLVAAWRGESDLAVGNVVGSNIFNLLLILGVTCSVRSVPVPAGGLVDLGVMFLFALALLVMSMTHARRLTRGEGAALVASYVAYVVWRVS